MFYVFSGFTTDHSFGGFFIGLQKKHISVVIIFISEQNKHTNKINKPTKKKNKE